MDTPIINNDQFPLEYTAVTFGGGEVPTSAKLNTVTQESGAQFDIMAIGLGNTFIHGINNLGAAIAGGPSNGSTVGQFANLTNYQNPAANVATVPAIFTASPYVNQMTCVINAQTVGGLWPIQVSGTLLASHHTITGTSPTQVTNILIARRPGGTGPITDIFYPTNCTTTDVGDVTTFTTDVVGLYQSTTDFIVLSSNVSLIDALVQTIKNVGYPVFSSTVGRINPTNDNLLDTAPAGAPLSNEINNVENKLFSVRWHARVQKSIGMVISGTNSTWTITASSAGVPFQSGSTPSPTMVSNYIANLGGLTPGSTSLESFACVYGAPIMQPTAGPIKGTAYPVTVTVTANSMTLSMPTAALANVSNTAPIDMYFPILIPYRLLQSTNIDYDTEGAMTPDWFANVVGLQYAWNTTPYPDSIANRLDTDEGNINSVASFANSIGASVIPNGSFEFWSPAVPIPTPNQWLMGRSNGTVTWAQDNTNNIHGGSALNIFTGTSSGGSCTATSQTPIPLSVQSGFFLKWKTYATASTAHASIVINFFSSNGAGGIGASISSVTMWDQTNANSGTGGSGYPTSYRTFWGQIADATSNTPVVRPAMGSITIPTGAKFMTITIQGGDGSQLANQNILFDGVEFFQPGKSGSILSFSSHNTYSFTTPSNATNIVVTLVGAGAGGGGGGTGGYGAGGGGGAGAVIKAPLMVFPDTVYTVTVGQGGNGGGGGSTSPANGTNGGASYIFDPAGNAMLIAGGGSYGYGGTGPFPGNIGGAGGAGGNISTFPGSYGVLNKMICITIGYGQNGANASNGNANGGSGAGISINNSLYISASGGQGGLNGTTTPTNQNGSAPGAGGGGGANGFYNYGGGSGADGQVLIEF